MIESLSAWAKGLGVTIVIVSIFEMLLPNNNSKKYIRMVLGIYVIFNIITPLIKNKEEFNIDNLNLEDYQTVETTSVDQTSMDARIKELYEQELEKDITKKLKEKGYEVTSVKVDTEISNEEETENSKIKLKIEKRQEQEEAQEDEEDSAENKIVTEIQKIKKVDTSIKIDENAEIQTESKKEDTEKVSKVDIQNVKKFLIEEYGVNEKCLEIN